MSLPSLEFQTLTRRLLPGGKLLRAWPLTGGVSAQVTALEIQLPDGTTQKRLVRRHGPNDLATDPHIAAHEFSLLQQLHAAGLSVPAPLSFDESGEIFPTPYIVIEFIEGQTEFSPADLNNFIQQFAEALANIHRFNLAAHDLSFLPNRTQIATRKLAHHPDRLDDSLQEGRIRAALEPVWPPTQHNPTTLLHCDCWPGNLLWRSGQLAAVIDWEDAALGDPLADLANSRLELLWAFGDEAMQQFTATYQSLMQLDLTNLPYWDLYAALKPAFQLSEWAANPEAEANMRAHHHRFVAQAFEALQLR